MARRQKKKRTWWIWIIVIIVVIGVFGGKSSNDESESRSKVETVGTTSNHMPTNTPEPTGTPEPTDTPEPTPGPASTPERIRGRLADTEVYVSNSNGIVHSHSNCSGMKYYWTTTIKAADEAGYNFCDKCW